MNPTSARRWIVFGALVAIVLAVAAPALAHATYKSSNPADESTVASPPGEITAEFTEPMSDGSYMDVTDPCGRDVGSGSNQTGNSMSVQNSGTAAGTYVVFWLAVSIDSHKTEGEFTFTSTGGDPCPGGEEEEDTSGGGGGGNDRGGSGSDSGEDNGGSVPSTNAGSTEGDEGDPRGRHDKHGSGVMKKNRNRNDSGTQTADTTLAGGDEADVPEAPSAIEGIPLDGLLITLAVAALIGAAAGKIYVSLSGDGS